MKKIILLLFFVHLAVTALCQTVSIIDLKQLSKGGNAGKILARKSFQLVQTKHPKVGNQTLYTINNHTPKAEFIQLTSISTSEGGTLTNDVNYMSTDTDYVLNIMKQINMSGIKTTGKKVQKLQTIYSFDSKKLFVQIIVKKNNALQSTVQIHPK